MHLACLSGGGAKGAFQGGVLEGLTARGIRFAGYVGSSTGAIQAGYLSQANGTLTSQALYIQRLKRLWFGVRGPHDVYRNGWLRAVWYFLRGKPHLTDYTPFARLLRANLVRGPRLPVRLATVSLDTGRFVRQEPATATQLIRAVLASASIPLIAPPVASEGLVDGGVREVTPLGETFDLARTLRDDGEPITIWLVNATPIAGAILPDAPSGRDWRRATLRQVAERTFWIMSHELIENDHRGALDTNALIMYLDFHGLKRPPWLQNKIAAHIERFDPPVQAVPYGTLDFTPAQLRAAWQAGYEMAR